MKEQLITLIQTYGPDVVVSIIVTTLILVTKNFLDTRDKNKKVRKVLYRLVSEAELFLASKPGQEKKSQVIDWFLSRYKFLSLFVSKETLSTLIDEEAGKLKEYLKTTDETVVADKKAE